MTEFKLDLSSRLLKAKFINRPNRFLVNCLLEGQEVKAFLPNPGRLLEILLPGRILILSRKTGNSFRKTEYTVLAVFADGYPVLLDTHVANSVAKWLIETDQVPGLEGMRVKRSEIPYSRSRFDFLLFEGDRECYLEVKSCTFFAGRFAMFPDAPSERASRHVRELAQIAKEGKKSVVLIIVQSQRPKFFLPEFHTDPHFARTLYEARKAVKIIPLAISWETDLSVSREVNKLPIPWDILEKESGDRGSYVLIMELDESQVIKVGALGDLYFKKGFYVYVGSAMKGLDKRISRHLRRRKNFHWHIDYLRDVSKGIKVLAVRSSQYLECEIAKALNKLTDKHFLEFGSSDCKCGSHLFFFMENPLYNEAFIKTIMKFRIERLEKLINLAQDK